jgi:hypothetical protein
MDGVFERTNLWSTPAPNSAGLAFDGTWLWYASLDPPSIYGLSLSGEVRRRFLQPGLRRGLAYYRRTLLALTGPSPSLRFLRRDGAEVGRLRLPPGDRSIGSIDALENSFWVALPGAVEQRSMSTGETLRSFPGVARPSGLVATARELVLADRGQPRLTRIRRDGKPGGFLALEAAPSAIASDRRRRLWTVEDEGLSVASYTQREADAI